MSRLKFSEEAKAHDDILALCEAYSQDYNSDMQKRAFVKEEEEHVDAPADNGEISVDDMYNTVDIPGEESHEGPSFNPDEIELSEEDKEAAKSLLVNLLNDVTNSESISEPALEMIVNEVATQSSYLNEAEEGVLNGPVEKDSFVKSKIEAVKKYLLSLLGFAEENNGQLPEGTDVPAETEIPAEGEMGEVPAAEPEAGESTEHETSETPAEEKTEEEKDESAPLNEAGEKPVGEETSEVSPDGADKAEPTNESAEVAPEGSEAPVANEGVCTECDAEGVLEVDPKETIRIVGEEDGPVTAIGEEMPEGDVPGAPEIPGQIDGIEQNAGIDGVEDDAKTVTVGDLKTILDQYLGNGKASAELFESITTAASLPKVAPKGFQKTEKPATETPKMPTTASVVLPKVTPKGFQKTKDVGSLPEGAKKGTLTPVSNSEVTLTKVTPKGFQQTSKPSAEAPTTTPPATVAPTREPAGTQTHKKVADKETAKVVAAVMHEGKNVSVGAFLAEAREAIINARKQINS